MRKIILFICFIFFVNIGLSQKNYFYYHKKIIKAEELFLKDSVNLSLKEYSSIFNEYSPFAKDAFIAFQLACMNNDTFYANLFLLYCGRAGINWRLFDQVAYTKNFINKDSVFKKSLQKKYSVEREKYFSKIDTTLRSYFFKLSKKDNKAKYATNVARLKYLEWLNNQNDSFQKIYDTNLDTLPIIRNYRLKNKDSTSDFYQSLVRNAKKRYVPWNSSDTSFVSVLESNICILDSVSKKLGYIPGEKTIGILDEDYNPKSIETLQQLIPIIIQTLFHHGCGFWMMQNEFIEAIKRGEIHPRYYGILYNQSYCGLRDKSNDMSANNLSVLYKLKCPHPPKEKMYKLLKLSVCPEELSSSFFINKCRLELSISSLEHDARKKEYAKHHKLILFFGLFGEEI